MRKVVAGTDADWWTMWQRVQVCRCADSTMMTCNSGTARNQRLLAGGRRGWSETGRQSEVVSRSPFDLFANSVVR